MVNGATPARVRGLAFTPWALVAVGVVVDSCAGCGGGVGSSPVAFAGSEIFAAVAFVALSFALGAFALANLCALVGVALVRLVDVQLDIVRLLFGFLDNLLQKLFGPAIFDVWRVRIARQRDTLRVSYRKGSHVVLQSIAQGLQLFLVVFQNSPQSFGRCVNW